jgi:hypothetical protein
MKIKLNCLAHTPKLLVWTKITHHRKIGCKAKTDLCMTTNRAQRKKNKNQIFQASQLK